MDYYQLKVDDRSNSEWKAILLKDEDSKKNIIQTINENIELRNIEFPIQMFLINIIKNKSDRKEKMFANDLVNWVDDITLNAYKASNGLIVSSNFKTFLENFDLGKHKFYEVELINVENPVERKIFYLFHSMMELNDFTDYEKSEFVITDYSNQTTIKKEVGLFRNKEDYIKANEEYFKHNRGVKISKRHVYAKHDIIYGFSNNLIVNERIKLAIHTSTLKGIKLKPFREIIS